MKKLHLFTVLAISAILVTSCGNNSGGASTNGDSTKTDSSATIIPPPDNSSATNPSLADTNFSKNHADTAGIKKDSSKMKH